MGGRSCGFRPPIACLCQRTCQRQCLPRASEAACCPLGPEHVTCWKIGLSADLAPVHTARTTQHFLLLVEFYAPGDWPLHLPDLTPLYFPNWSILLALCLMPIWSPYVHLFPWNGASWQWKIFTRPDAHSTIAITFSLRKMKFKLNR
jgi:hypothetical protein